MFFEQLYMLKIEDFLKFQKSYICCAYITFSNFNNLNIYNFGVIYIHLSRKSTKFVRKLNIIFSYIFSLACPNPYEHLMFFDPLAISEIIKKSRIFLAKTKNIKTKNDILYSTKFMKQNSDFQWILVASF